MCWSAAPHRVALMQLDVWHWLPRPGIELGPARARRERAGPLSCRHWTNVIAFSGNVTVCTLIVFTNKVRK